MKKGRPKGGRQPTGPVFDLLLALMSELALSCLLSLCIVPSALHPNNTSHNFKSFSQATL